MFKLTRFLFCFTGILCLVYMYRPVAAQGQIKVEGCKGNLLALLRCAALLVSFVMQK